MECYNEKGLKLFYDCQSEASHRGTSGLIYLLGDGNCLKKYFTVDSSKLGPFDDCYATFTQEMFNYFKNSKLSSFCELGELLYDSNDLEKRKVIGYTMKYYESVTDSFAYLPMEYIINGYALIYESISRLTEDNIDVVDFNNTNIVLSKGQMTVIDFDKYHFSQRDFDQRRFLNQQQLSYAFTKLFEKGLEEQFEEEWELYKEKVKVILKDIFYSNPSPYSVGRKLRNYGSPIDMIGVNNVRKRI